MAFCLIARMTAAAAAQLLCVLPASGQDIHVFSETRTTIADDAGAEGFRTTLFPATGVGHASFRSFGIRNSQSPNNLLLTLPLTVTGANASDFIITGQPGSTIVPFGVDVLFVKFEPTGTGVRTATITINSNDPDSESTFVMNLQGLGYTGLTTLKPDLRTFFARPPKSKFNKKDATTYIRGKVDVFNLSAVPLESGTAYVYRGDGPYFDSTAQLLTIIPFGALPGFDEDKKLKRLRFSFKVDGGNVSSGALFVRVYPEQPISDDWDWFDNQAWKQYENKNK